MNKDIPNPIEGFRCNQIRCFEPIFKEWRNCVTEIAEGWKQWKDVPWWYNERASLSLFAGAVWRAGGFCFEEYSDQKRIIGRRSHRLGASYPGRVDLYFSWHNIDFIAEAKYTYSGFSRSRATASDRLNRRLKKACQDIRQTKPYGQRRLGILFARPVFKKDVKTKIDEELNLWVEMLKGLDTNAYAWVFPSCARFAWSSDGYFCPGEAVLIKEIWK